MQNELQILEKQKAVTCCVAGHRDLAAEYLCEIRQSIDREIRQAANDGYIFFLTDFKEGTDQLFAEIVKDIAKEIPHIHLVALLPYRSKFDKLMQDDYAGPLLGACSDIGYACERYARNSDFICRRRLLGYSSRMITVYDGRDDGGTVSAIRMAHVQRLKIREIAPGLK